MSRQNTSEQGKKVEDCGNQPAPERHPAARPSALGGRLGAVIVSHRHFAVDLGGIDDGHDAKWHATEKRAKDRLSQVGWDVAIAWRRLRRPGWPWWRGRRSGIGSERTSTGQRGRLRRDDRWHGAHRAAKRAFRLSPPRVVTDPQSTTATGAIELDRHGVRYPVS